MPSRPAEPAARIRGGHAGHLAGIRDLYGDRCRAMRAAVAASFPKGTRCTDPSGGLFLWASVPGVDADELLVDALRDRVAFVPGAPFFARTPDRSALRLNFSNRPSELIAAAETMSE